MANVELDIPSLRRWGQSEPDSFFDWGAGRTGMNRLPSFRRRDSQPRARWQGVAVDLALARRLAHPDSVSRQGGNLQDDGVHLQSQLQFLLIPGGGPLMARYKLVSLAALRLVWMIAFRLLSGWVPPAQAAEGAPGAEPIGLRYALVWRLKGRRRCQQWRLRASPAEGGLSLSGNDCAPARREKRFSRPTTPG